MEVMDDDGSEVERKKKVRETTHEDKHAEDGDVTGLVEPAAPGGPTPAYQPLLVLNPARSDVDKEYAALLGAAVAAAVEAAVAKMPHLQPPPRAPMAPAIPQSPPSTVSGVRPPSVSGVNPPAMSGARPPAMSGARPPSGPPPKASTQRKKIIPTPGNESEMRLRRALDKKIEGKQRGELDGEQKRSNKKQMKVQGQRQRMRSRMTMIWTPKTRRTRERTSDDNAGSFGLGKKCVWCRHRLMFESWCWQIHLV